MPIAHYITHPVDSGAVFPPLPVAPDRAAAGPPGACAESVAALTAGVRRGEEAAVRQLYAAYSLRLTRYALVITHGDEAASAEAVQAAFLRAMRSLRCIQEEPALWAWLARAVRCAATDAARGERRRATLLSRFRDLLQPAAYPPLEDTENVWHTALEHALTELDPDSRALLHARYTEHIPLEEIAITHATTGRAIEGRLARLREKLRHSILRQLASLRHES